MIIDSLKNITSYAGLSERISAALAYLTETDFAKLPDGKREIRGEEIFAIVQRYQTKPLEQGKWEAHRSYIDVQCVVAGREQLGFGYVDDMQIVQEYSRESDCMLLEGKGGFVTLSAGMFALLFPHDAHMPGITDNSPSEVTKIVVKILVQ